jgi:hypothetical protein
VSCSTRIDYTGDAAPRGTVNPAAIGGGGSVIFDDPCLISITSCDLLLVARLACRLPLPPVIREPRGANGCLTATGWRPCGPLCAR